jgi:phage N-6-adenine-methyltransferase
VSVLNYRAKNPPQQVAKRGASSDVDDRALPVEAFAMLNERFRFSVDAAASAHNAKLPRFFSIANCGLAASWAGERVYCNPPYSSIEPWVIKAWREEACPLIVMILPANRTEQGWWQRWIEPKRDHAESPLHVEFCPGRQRFLRPGQRSVGPNERPPFGLALCIWTRPWQLPPNLPRP